MLTNQLYPIVVRAGPSPCVYALNTFAAPAADTINTRMARRMNLEEGHVYGEPSRHGTAVR